MCEVMKFCREVGTIVRALGCYPSEADLADIIAEVLTFIKCLNVHLVVVDP